MKCEKCGYDAPERAVICPECGAIFPRPSSPAPDDTPSQDIPQGFTSPFLSANPETLDQQPAQDPREQAMADKIRRNTIRRRLIAGIVAGVILLGVILYQVFLGGYKLAAFRYVKGMDYESGGLYLGLVPDNYLDYLEDTYEMTRRDVKDALSAYFVSWNENYGNPGAMSYDITSKTDLDDSEILALEEELGNTYGISADIAKAVEVNFRIDDGGEVASEHAVFVKIGMKWCCMEAMEQIDYVCQYNGYGQW